MTWLQLRFTCDAATAAQLAELLAERGANPTIRDKARKWSQDKRFWKDGKAC